MKYIIIGTLSMSITVEVLTTITIIYYEDIPVIKYKNNY